VTPLVLLHGAGRSGDDWDALRPHLAPLEVLTPSLPGRGGVPGPAPASAEEAAQFVVRHAISQKAPRFIAVGHSYGGAIALELAIAHADRIAALVLIATGARLRVHPAIFVALSAGLDPAHGGEAWSSPVPIESAIADWRAVDAFDRLKAPLNVRAPCLVIAGEDDALTPPKYARYLAANIPGAELELVPSEGHMLPFDRPELVARRIQQFLNRQSAS
jgi:pimeloyl-ACP methyl ester carboxylesterase